MSDLTCKQCQSTFEQKYGKRPMLFCGTDCRNKFYRSNRKPTGIHTQKNCDICSKEFLQTKSNQRYCSAACYKKSWVKNNREKHNARVAARRVANPEWYRAREPGYSKIYKAKLLSSRPWTYLLRSAQARAKENGWQFELTDTWAKARWTGHCEITGLTFQTSGKRGPHPFSPSVDRKDSSKVYTEDNSRFILWGCNAIKGVGDDIDMLTIAKAIAATEFTIAPPHQEIVGILALPG